jgi:hypothetical protein
MYIKIDTKICPPPLQPNVVPLFLAVEYRSPLASSDFSATFEDCVN